MVADVIRRFTGVQVKDYGGAGGLKTVNVRSLGSEHVGIFIDGIKIDNAQNMQVDLGRFSTRGISSVALYNSRKSSRMQTAAEYSAGASVHLDTDRPRHRDGCGGVFRLRGGSFASVNPSLQWDHELGPVTLRASAEFLYNNGKYKYPFFDTTLVRENGDIRSLRLETQLFAAPRGGDIRLRIYAYGSERGFPGPVIRRAMGFPLSAERQADQNFFVQGSWTQDWGERYSTALRLKYANDYIHYNTHPENNPMALPYDLHYRQQSAFLSLSQSVLIAESFAIDLAADVQRNSLDSDAGQFVTPRRTTANGALSARFSLEDFRAEANISYIGAWDRFKTPDAGGWSMKDSFRGAWMPSISVYAAPAKWLEADLFAKYTCRLPSFNDLYYSLIGNSALKPEYAAQFGADVSLSAETAHWNGILRLSPYYNRVTNKILAIPTASQFRWSMLNIGKADITGLDVKIENNFTAGQFNAQLTLRYTLQKALNLSDQESISWKNQLPYIPLHSGSADLTLGWRKWQLGWNTILNGKRWSNSANLDEFLLAPWSVTDISLSKTFSLKPFRGRSAPSEITVSANCNNIFNCRYEIVKGYPMPGVNAFLSVEYRL